MNLRLQIRLSVYFSIVFAMFLSSCSSAIKTAQELIDAGQEEEALKISENALTANPANSDAIKVKSVAQEKIYNKELIKLKSLIDSQSVFEAFDLIRTIHDRRKNWTLEPNSNSNHFFEQQRDKLYSFYLSLKEQSLKENHSLKAFYYQVKYRDLFAPLEIDREKSLKAQLNEIGKKQCIDWDQKSMNLPSLRLFAIEYCSLFQVKIEQTANNLKKMNLRLSKFTVPKININGLSEVEKSELSQLLQAAQKQLPHFETNGSQNTEVQLIGSLTQKIEEQQKQLIHSYTIKIPYINHVVKEKIVNQPYTASEQRCASSNPSQCWTESVTRYKETKEPFEATETALRDEPRTYQFTGKETKQNLSFNLISQSTFDEKSIEVPYQNKLEEIRESHNFTLLDYGLTPVPLKLIERSEWFKTVSVEFTNQFVTAFHNQWLNSTCRNEIDTSLYPTQDLVFFCLRDKKAYELNFVQEWLQKNLNVTVAEFRTVFRNL